MLCRAKSAGMERLLSVRCTASSRSSAIARCRTPLSRAVAVNPAARHLSTGAVSQPTVKLNDGSVVPQLGLGTWRSPPDMVTRAVDHAVRVGYRHVDCAAIYDNEHEVGQALESVFRDSVVKRDDLYIVSKLWNTHHHPDDVEPAVVKSLRDLRLSHLDMYLIHWPVAFARGNDPYPETAAGLPAIEDIPIADTWGAMERLVSKGLVKSIGVCNFSAAQLKDLCRSSSTQPVVNQVECHPYFPQAELRQTCAELGVALTAYSPLGSLNKHSPPVPVELLQHPVLETIAADLTVSLGRKVTTAQVLIRWSLQLGNMCIPKSVTPSRIESNLEALSLPEFDESALEFIEEISKPPIRLLNPQAFSSPPAPFFAD